MRWIWLILGLWALPSAAAELRGGEHDGFTRFVLTVPLGADWRLGRTDDGYALWVDGADGWDLDTALARTRRDRVADVSQSGGAIRFALTCACHATVIPWRPDRIVLDFVEGPPGADSPFEAPFLDPPTTVAETDKLSNGPLAATDPPEQVPKLPPEPPTGPQFAPGELESGLARNLAGGIEAGLLVSAQHEPGVSLAPSMLTSLPILSAQDSPLPGVVARDAYAAVNAMGQKRQESEDCSAEQDFALPEWQGSVAYAAALSQRRAALHDARDRPSPDAFEALAVLLIAGGFGREAEAVLASDGLRSVGRDRIRLMAALVEESGTVPPDPGDLSDCGGTASIWALLAQEPERFQGDSGVLALSFAGLPAPVQGAIGPRLARRLLTVDQIDTGRRILGQARSSGFADAQDLTLTDAMLLQIDGDDDGAAHGLAGLLSAATVDPHVVAELLELVSKGAVPLDPAYFATADFLRAQYRRSSVLDALDRSRMAARLAHGDWDAALAILRDEERSDAAQADLVPKFYAALARDAPDDDFLIRSFEPLPELQASIENDIAARLLSLGFPDRAVALILPEAEGPEAARRVALRAELARAMGNPAAAAALEGGPSPSQFTAAAHDPGPVADHATAPADNEMTSVTAPPATLAGLRALLAESAKTRDMVGAMLAVTGNGGH